jgi:hypothetical protein
MNESSIPWWKEPEQIIASKNIEEEYDTSSCIITHDESDTDPTGLLPTDVL